jgi:hypothetical protein
VYVRLWGSQIGSILVVVVDTMPRVVVEADDYAPFGKSSLIVVAESKECESLLVSIVVFVDTSDTRIRFAVEDLLLVQI